MTAWTQLCISCPANQADLIANLLHELGALSVTLEDAADQAIFQLKPEETPLWEETKVVALFSQQTDINHIIVRIKHELQISELNYQVSTLEDQDWVHLTQKNFPPQCFAENLWVLPSWCDTANYQNNIVKIDPGLAFGTGTHPTTALCLEWLARHPPKDKIVIDYGCGSGILALAALAVGATEVYATDHDAQALQATHNNAQLNQLNEDQLYILNTDEMPDIKVPLILANILSQPLIQLAPTITEFANNNSQLVLSGILIQEVDTVIKAYGNFGFKASNALTKDEWACVILEP